MRKTVRFSTAILAAALVASSLSARQSSRGYELDYIQSSGTQFIDTGVTPDKNTRTVIDMICFSTVKNAGLFGIENMNISYSMYRNTGSPAGWGMTHRDGSGDWQYSGHLADTARHVFDFNRYIAASNAYFLVYDDQKPYTKFTGTITKTGSASIHLGGRRTSNGAPGNISTHRFYSCRIYNGDTLVRDLVPWVSPAGATGLWDRVNGNLRQCPAPITPGYSGGQIVTNRVYFFSEWEDKCSSSPAFHQGGHIYAHGDTVTAAFSAPSLGADGGFSDGLDDFRFQGWRLWRNGEVVATGPETTVSFTHDASSVEEVEWLVAPDFHFTFTPEGPGTIVTNGLSADWTITMTAVPAEGKAFFRWKGDLDLGDNQVANPLTVSATRSRSFVAEFYDPATEPRVTFEAIEATAATGGQWIDTGYCPKSTTRTRVDFQPLETTTQQRVFGAGGSGTFYQMYRNGSSKWAYAYITAYDGNWVNTGYAANNTTRRFFDLNYWDDGLKKRCGAIYSTAGATLWSGLLSGTITRDSSLPLALGATRTGAKTYDHKDRAHRIYTATISESVAAGETVVRDFIPAAMRGVTGLWERVEGRLYPSASHQGGGYVGVNPRTNHLEVVSAEDWVDVTPAFGSHVCRNGETIAYHAPAVVTNGANAAICSGWRRYVNEVLVEEGSGNAFTRVKEWGKERVEWLFTSAFQVVAEAGEGGSVETEGFDEWYAGGTTNAVSTTAVPDGDHAFLYWSGDIPEGVDIHSPSISFEATKAVVLTPTFVRLDGENEVTLFEYVESRDDRQFINTGYLVSPTTWAVLDAQYLMNEGQAAIFGNRGPLNWAIYQRGTDAPGTANKLGYWLNATAEGYADVGKNADLDRHVFRCNYKVDDTTRGFRMYNVDGTAFSSQKTTTLQTQSATTPLCIGTWEPTYRPSRHRIYGLAIYEDGSDRPVRDFIPAAMGAATGVYDRIERKFYPSGGGGNYTVGTAPVAGRLYVDSKWRGLATASPAFGATDGLAAGATVSCSADAAVTNGATALACAGYILRRDGLTVSTGTVNAVTFQHAGGFEDLTWLYDASYRMEFAAGAGGSVSPANGWFAEGTSVTATATPDPGFAFFRWEGDLPEGADPASATLVFTADAPRSFTATFSEASASGTKLYTGADYGSWDTASNWTPEGVPTTADAVYIPAGVGVRIPLTADVFSLSISNGATVTVNGPNSKPSSVSGQTAGNTATTAPVGLTVRGDLLLLDAKLGIGGKNAHSYPYLAVGGDFTLSGASSFAIHPGPLDAASGHDYPDGGATVSVGGTTTVGSGSGMYPWSHVTTYNKADQELSTGLGSVFNLHALVVEEGGLVSGYGKGYTRYSKCPSATDAGTQARGGSHIGRGGATSSSGSRLAAFDRPYAPVMPGGGAGNGSATANVGGGAFRISATTVRLDGTIMSDGNPSTSATVGGAAGGSVFLLCDDLEFGPVGMLSATGSYGGDRNLGVGGGGGGGIAIALGLAQAQSAALVADGVLPSGVSAREATALVPDGRLSVKGGIGNQWNATWDDGGNGTAYYLVNNALSTLAVATVPATRAGVAPSAGLHAYAPGTTVSASAPASAPTILDPTEASAPTAATTPAAPADCASRRVCTGWTLTDGNGAVVASGDTTNATFTVGSGDYTLTWSYDDLDNRLDASAKAGGTVSLAQAWAAADASFPSLAATPDDADHVFAYWMGDIDGTNRFDNPVVLPADRARAVVAVFASATPKTYTWNKFGNSAVNNWHNPASWSPNGVPGPNDTAIISRASSSQANAQIDQYACVSNLVVRGAMAYLRVGSATTSYGNQNQGPHTAFATSSPIGLDVLGDLAVTNAAFVIVGGELLAQPAYVNVGGDLVVGGGTAQSRLCMYGSDANAVADARFGGTSRLTVAGTATVLDHAQIFASEHYKSDGYAAFSFRDLVVEEGGAVCAYNMGAKNYIRSGREINYPWPSHQQNSENVGFGGSHGGRGGANAKASGGAMQYVGEVFGYTNTPVHSGMQGGYNGGRPGGVLRIDARSIVLAGSLLAYGENGGNSGGAGGSVWVTCEEFSATASAVISVKGGAPTKDATGGGGGGRASVCVGLSDEQLLALRDSDEVEGVLRTPLADIVPGFTAAGGDCAGWTGSSGEDGTGVYIVHVGEGVTLTTSGEPVAAGVVSPAYGVTGQPRGEAIALEAPETAEVAGTDGLSRYVCGGWLVTNAEGTVLASGVGNTGSLTLAEDAFLTWFWTNVEHRVTISALGGGTVATNAIGHAASEWQLGGSRISVTAVPDDGYAFIGWLGGAQGLDRESATLEFDADQARDLTARFATAEAGVKTWIGGNGNWMNDAGWRPSGVPGPATETYVPSGTVTIDCGFPVPVGSLYVSGGAWIGVSASIDTSTPDQSAPTANDCATDRVGLRVAGDFDLCGKLCLGGFNQLRTGFLSVGGDLVLTNGAASYLIAFAGCRDNWGDPAMFREGGATVAVAGRMRVGNGTTVTPICASRSGAPVVFRLGDLLLEAGGRFYASYGGYAVYLSGGELVGYAPGTSKTRAEFLAAPYRGGSYGGTGGGSKVIAAYGTDFAPYQPGSPGGNTESGRAGGAIRIDVARTAEIYGMVIVNGPAAGNASRGGRSGGAIWITARRIVSSASASLQAKGGDQADNANSMGAGGGRICLAQKLTPEQIAALYEADTLPKGYLKTDLLAESVPEWQGTIDVSGGSLAARPANDGHPGTAVFVRAPIPPTMLLLR